MALRAYPLVNTTFKPALRRCASLASCRPLIPPGKTDIRKQQCNFAMSFEKANTAGTISSVDHEVTELTEQVDGQAANV